MSDSFVTVATFQDPVAASLAKNLLDGAGIPAILLDETTVATDWLLSGAIGGVKLQVAPLHLERAEMILARTQETERDEDDEDDQDDDDYEAAIAPTAFAAREIAEDLRSEREDKAPVNQLVDRMFRVAIFGLIFWPLQLYALWLLFQVMAEPGTVSDNRRWKVWTCILLTPPAVAMILLLGSSCLLPGIIHFP
jgi:hypothetical protein